MTSESASRGLEFTPQIRDLIDNSLESGHPVLLAAVGADGQPILSFRGSARTFSDHEIGIWVRKTQGGTLAAIRANPRVALMYRSQAVPMLQFQGLARVVTDEAARARIFELSPRREQDADPDRKGVALLIDVRQVEGVVGFVDDTPQFLRLAATS